MFIPDKIPPFHFVLNKMNRVPNTTNRERTFGSILPTYKVTPSIIWEKGRESTSNKINPFGGSIRWPNPLLTSNNRTQSLIPS
jgi:hypothetical protein